MPNADDPEDAHGFVKQFMDPATHEIAIAIALRDIQNSLRDNARLLSRHAAEMTTVIAEIRANLHENEIRIAAIEDTHKAEAAVRARDTTRLLWIHRIFGGLIALVLIALWNWILALSEQVSNFPIDHRL